MAEKYGNPHEGVGWCIDEFNWLEYTLFALLKSSAPRYWNQVRKRGRLEMASSMVEALYVYADAAQAKRDELVDVAGRLDDLNTRRNRIVHSLHRFSERKGFEYVRTKDVQKDLSAEFTRIEQLDMPRFLADCLSLRKDVLALMEQW